MGPDPACNAALKRLFPLCLAVFAEMAALLDRERIAQSAGAGGRRRNLTISRKAIIRPAQIVAIICYEAAAQRGDGSPYRALVGTGYVRRGPDWKMTFHQQTPLPAG